MPPRGVLAALAGALLLHSSRAHEPEVAPSSPPSSPPLYPQNLTQCTMQGKLSTLSPFPISVVWIEQTGDTMETIRQTFQTYRSLGFTALKQLLLRVDVAMTPEAFQAKTQAVMNAALDEGLIPWWYEVGGWECITLDLLASLGIPPDTPPWEVETDPKMIEYQTNVLRARIANMTFVPYQLGEPGAGNPTISQAQVPLFAAWLQETYAGNITLLQLTWQDYYRGNQTANEFENFTAAASLLTVPQPTHDYRRYRDSMRWQADALLSAFETMLQAALAHDPQEPQRTGGAMLLLNQAYYGWDLFKHGALAVDAGSFYISSHLPWHYSELQHEIDRPIYFSVRMAVDASRGAWPGEWESTGGPSQYSGGFSTAVEPGGMRKLLFTYIAAGMKGVGLWTGNFRQKGQEAAEYALFNLQGKPSQRAVAAGQVASALQTFRWELWRASDNPVVAILYSWEREAIAGRLFMQTPPFECTFDDLDCSLFNAREMNAPVLGRMGWARALIDAHVPWTHVDEDGVRGGVLDSLGPSLRTLILPHMMAMSTDLLPLIRAWQLRTGGRVVADMPWLLMGNDSIVIDQSVTAAEEIFGAYVEEFHSVETPFDGQTSQVTLKSGDGAPLTLQVSRGQYGVLGLTTGQVTLSFNAPFSYRPALVENRGGGGGGGNNWSSALVNFEAGKLGSRPQKLVLGGQPIVDGFSTTLLSAWMAGVATDNGALAPSWSATPLGIPVFLRSVPAGAVNATSPAAHHWIILLDDVTVAGAPADQVFPTVTNVTVSMPWATTSAIDAVTGNAIPFSAGPGGVGSTFTVAVPFRDGLWIRTTE